MCRLQRSGKGNIQVLQKHRPGVVGFELKGGLEHRDDILADILQALG
ncbi:MAG: hypothetical protein WAZ36_04975 [Sediminibacterium sp.]